MAFLLLGGSAYAAVTIDGGQIVTVPGSQTSPFDTNGNLTVGATTTGELHISNGGMVSSINSFIGNSAGATGLVTVDGTGSRWDNAGYLYVGNSGSGTLIITNGGIVSDEGFDNPDVPVINAIGYGVGSTGTVTITGPGSQWINISNLHVGNDGSGTLLVENGGVVVTGNDGHIGYGSTSTGIVTITGSGSRWNIGAGVAVGFSGNGTLNIFDGGVVSVMKNSYMGFNSGSSSVITVSGAGSQWNNANNLTVGGAGSATLLAENGGLVSAGMVTGQGTLSLDEGTLQARASNANFIGFTGAGIFELLSGGGTIDSNGFDIGASSSLSGVGSLTKTGNGTLTLTTANSYSGNTEVAQGTLALTGAGSILPGGAVNIANGATFQIDQTTANSGDYTFGNPLTGTGLLRVNLLADTNVFSFTPSAGNGFTGTVELDNSTFSLSNANTAALTNAMLVLGAGNKTTVGTGSQSIGGLGFDGGTAIFDLTAPSATAANGTIVTTGTLNATGSGTLQIAVPPSFSVAPPTLPTELSLFEQDSSNILVKLVDATGATVMGGGGNLTLVDQNGNVLSNDRTLALTNTTGGPTVAQGLYDYRLTTGPAAAGLYVNYGLTQIDLLGTGNEALVLSPRAGATGSAADLSARLTGSGDLTIAAGAGDYVSLSNSDNNYTGTTAIRSGSLLFGNNNVLGLTDNLVLDTGTQVNMAGYSQSIGALNTATGSEITVSGPLTITGSQRATGDLDGSNIENNTLFGHGALIIDPSILYVNGTQAGYTGELTLTGGSQLYLNTADAFNHAQGIDLVSAADTLTFGDLHAHNAAWTSIANGTLQTSLSGLGTVQLQAGTDVAFTGNNSHFAGRFETALSSVLRAFQAQSLGTANIDNEGTFIATANNDWALSNAMTGAGTFIKDGVGTLQVDQSLSGFSGQTQVEAGTLQLGSALQAGTIGGSVNIASAATLSGIGTVAGNTLNSGILAPGLNETFGALTLAGNYAATGGVVHIKTSLGDDASPTDKLTVTGNAQGNTAVKVTNLGGLGAQTLNGINIIGVGGLAQDSAFSLAGDYITADGQPAVIAGAYAYTLQANGSAAAAGRNWSLTSALTPSEPEVPGVPVVPEEPDGGSGPRYQAGVPLYEQYSQVLAALNTLPTLQQRVGNRYWSPSSGLTDTPEDNQWAWGRIEGSHQVTDPARSTSDSSRDVDVWKLQTGVDMPLYRGKDGSLLTGGVNFSYGKANADIHSYFGDGTIDASGYGLGTTLTWYGTDGVYVDGQLQAMWFNSDLNSSTEGHSVANGNNGKGYASSVETGKHYSLGNGLSLTPQMQLTYTRVDFDTFVDPYDSKVSLEDGDSLRGRIGISLDSDTSWIAKDGTTSRSHLYSNLDLYNEFLNGSKTRVSGVDFTTRDERQSVGIGAGITHEWQNGRYAVYGNVNLLTATRHAGDNYAVGGTVGIRMNW